MKMDEALEIVNNWPSRGRPARVSDAELLKAVYVNDGVLSLALDGETGIHRPYVEAARNLGMDRSTVKRRAVRIIRRLRHRLDPSPTPNGTSMVAP